MLMFVFTNTDQFGFSVANLGYITGDTIPETAVGSRLDNDGGADREEVAPLCMT